MLIFLLHLQFYQHFKDHHSGKLSEPYFVNIMFCIKIMFCITLKDCFLEPKFLDLPERPQVGW